MSTNLTGLNASSWGQLIFNGEGYSNLNAFIGQSGSNNDSAATPKIITSFGNIRGLAPLEANALGSFYSASVAAYAWLNDVNSAKDNQFIKTYSVALSSPAPEFTFNVAGNPVTIIPFAKSVQYFGISAGRSAFQPTNNIVDFYIESYTPTSAVIRVNYDDMQQGGDFDMDSIVKYYISINGSTITITTQVEYSAGVITQHLGYIISGTTADGIYLEVVDTDTRTDIDYFLDTPPGQPPNGNWNDRISLPTSTTRVFNSSNQPSATVLKSPLWFAAKWGGFEDINNSGRQILRKNLILPVRVIRIITF